MMLLLKPSCCFQEEIMQFQNLYVKYLELPLPIRLLLHVRAVALYNNPSVIGSRVQCTRLLTYL